MYKYGLFIIVGVYISGISLWVAISQSRLVRRMYFKGNFPKCDEATKKAKIWWCIFIGSTIAVAIMLWIIN